MTAKPLFGLIERNFALQGFVPDAIVAFGKAARLVLDRDLKRLDDDAISAKRTLFFREAGSWKEAEPTVSIADTPEGSQSFLDDAYAKLSRMQPNGAPSRSILLAEAASISASELSALVDERVAAVVIVNSSADDPDGWRSTRALFDLGLIACGTAKRGRTSARCYLRSDLMTNARSAAGVPRGAAGMSDLGANGRFANQLFQYAFLRLYALRHDLTPVVPTWEGRDIFRLLDPALDGLLLRPLRFQAFDDDDRALWKIDDPPVDVDFSGYFQELPGCWKPHRAFLRNLFSLEASRNTAIDGWLAGLTEGGRRPLVALHVRRGDYVTLHEQGLPWYRPVPIEWYESWIDDLKLTDPVIFVATDDPADVLSRLAHLHPLSGADAPAGLGIPGHLLDFEVLKRASHLAVANSSYSRMAAILGPDDQTCSIPDFDTQTFVPYAPWEDYAFWQRFEAGNDVRSGRGNRPDAILYRSIALRLELSNALAVVESLQQAERGLLEHASNLQLQVENKWLTSVDKTGHEIVLNLKATIAQLEEQLEQHRQKDVARQLETAELRHLVHESQEISDDQTALISELQAEREAYFAKLRHADSDAENLSLANRLRHEAFEGELKEMAERLLDERKALGQERFFALALSEDIIRLERELSAARTLLDSFYFQLKQMPNETRGDELRLPQAALRKAEFLGSPAGLARRAAARPLMGVLRMLRVAANKIGARQVAAKLHHDETLLFDRRYRDYLDLNRARFRRLVSVRPPHRVPSGIARGLEAPPVESTPRASPSTSANNASHTASTGLPEVNPAEASKTSLDFTATVFEPRRRLLVIVPWLMQGGSEVVLLDVLAELKHDHAVTIVTTVGAGHSLRSAFEHLAEEIHHLGESLDENGMSEFVSELLRHRDYAVLLSSNSHFWYRNAARLKKLAPGLRTIDILHNDLPDGHIRSAIAASDGIDVQVAVSRRVADSLSAAGLLPEQIATIPNGVDTQDLFDSARVDRAEARRKLGIARDSFVLGFAGRFSNEKRPMAFLDIADAVSEEVDIHVVMIGEGPLAEEVHDRLMSSPFPATQRRHVARADMPEVYAAMDVVVLVSTIEGMPLVILEGLASGRPVAVTRVGDVERIVVEGVNGFIVPPDDYMGLVPSIVALAGNKKNRTRMEAAARRSITEAGLTKAAMLRQYRELVFPSQATPPIVPA